MSVNICTIPIYTPAQGNKEPRIDSRVMAKLLSRKHRSVFRQISNKLKRFKEHGQVRFEIAVGERLQGGGNPEKYALLNEAQSYLLLTFSRNTAVTEPLKSKLIAAFMKARHQLQARQTEYLPAHHALHDSLQGKADTPQKQRLLHMNVNKHLNRVTGLQSGQRNRMTFAQQSVMTVMQMVATQAAATAQDHKQAYQAVKQSTQALTTLLTQTPAQEVITQ